MYKKTLTLVSLLLSSPQVQATSSEEPVKESIEAIVATIQADQASGKLDPKDADLFLGMVRAYPNYPTLKEDLEKNGVTRPWYETSLIISLVNTILTAFYFTKNMYEKVFTTEIFKVGCNTFKKRGFYVLGSLFVLLPIIFVVNFLCTGPCIYIANEFFEDDAMVPKGRLSDYLVQKGWSMQPQYQTTGFFITLVSIGIDVFILNISIITGWAHESGTWMGGIVWGD